MWITPLISWRSPTATQHAKELSRMYMCGLQILEDYYSIVVHAPVSQRGPAVTYHEKGYLDCTVQYLCGLQTTRGLPVVHAPDLPDTPQAF